ncbi:GNAT family N-acetyltransferase [Erysipelothrix urinaevulpis]|uniref:GNAT family N-acetyltransferase n=1 Tax=Erysipelothrix urinaevulpis TaxID=2683717 RepID=UPI00135BE8E1|nr:GNAT family N-acetyltransferase [Erysipelothrix urinaevulpis]
MHCIRLCELDEKVIFDCFKNAFSDYIVPMDMTYEAFLTMLFYRGYTADLSFGIVENDHLVGFVINGTDTSKPAQVYDISTGIIPAYQGQGLGRVLLKYTVDSLKKSNFNDYSLEVITSNTQAIKSYSSLGFIIEKELVTYELSYAIEQGQTSNHVEKTTLADILNLTKFNDYKPSWQNDVQAIIRAEETLSFYVYRLNGQSVAYAIIDLKTGNISQLAVIDSKRRKGIATELMLHLITVIHCDKIRIINCDKRDRGLECFLKEFGFKLKIRQFEMKYRIE